ncbi:hypothetical protein GEMRC1_006577 [Eukaryota sp. GEM-RC1]
MSIDSFCESIEDQDIVHRSVGFDGFDNPRMTDYFYFGIDYDAQALHLEKDDGSTTIAKLNNNQFDVYTKNGACSFENKWDYDLDLLLIGLLPPKDAELIGTKKTRNNKTCRVYEANVRALEGETYILHWCVVDRLVYEVSDDWGDFDWNIQYHEVLSAVFFDENTLCPDL